MNNLPQLLFCWCLVLLCHADLSLSVPEKGLFRNKPVEKKDSFIDRILKFKSQLLLPTKVQGPVLYKPYANFEEPHIAEGWGSGSQTPTSPPPTNKFSHFHDLTKRKHGKLKEVKKVLLKKGVPVQDELRPTEQELALLQRFHMHGVVDYYRPKAKTLPKPSKKCVGWKWDKATTGQPSAHQHKMNKKAKKKKKPNKKKAKKRRKKQKKHGWGWAIESTPPLTRWTKKTTHSPTRWQKRVTPNLDDWEEGIEDGSREWDVTLRQQESLTKGWVVPATLTRPRTTAKPPQALGWGWQWSEDDEGGGSGLVGVPIPALPQIPAVTRPPALEGALPSLPDASFMNAVMAGNTGAVGHYTHDTGLDSLGLRSEEMTHIVKQRVVERTKKPDRNNSKFFLNFGRRRLEVSGSEEDGSPPSYAEVPTQERNQNQNRVKGGARPEGSHANAEPGEADEVGVPVLNPSSQLYFRRMPVVYEDFYDTSVY